MNKEELKTILDNHKLWLEDNEKGKRAYLQDANLQGADLQEANLRGADLDYSCFPLWCGGINWKVDKNLPNMLAAFICSMNCDDEKVKEMQALLLPHAKDSHRYEDILGGDK